MKRSATSKIPIVIYNKKAGKFRFCLFNTSRSNYDQRLVANYANSLLIISFRMAIVTIIV